MNIRNSNTIVIDRDRLFLSHHFQVLLASNRILWQRLTAYHQQTDPHTEILNKEVVTIVPVYKLAGDKLVKKLPEIQLKRNCRYYSSQGSSPSYTLYGLTRSFGQVQMPYPLIKIVARTDRNAQVTDNLTPGKARQSLQAKQR